MIKRYGRLRAAVAALAVIGAATTTATVAFSGSGVSAAVKHAEHVFELTSVATTTTPIKHVVVIFDENVSFDHYFATYPVATNTDGEPFYATPGTPPVNGLSGSLLSANPNGINPIRLDPSNVNNVLTCDQNHSYTPEQKAADNGNEDKFPTNTATATGNDPEGQACTNSTVMDYYDGNVVTAEWNYAQHFAMSDNNYGSTYGPSTEGALNVISGDTSGVDTVHAVRNVLTDGDTVTYTNPDGGTGTTVIGDAQPYWDDCSTGAAVALDGQNIGDQLNVHNLSWGWFQGGFTPDSPYAGSVSTEDNYNQLSNPDAVTCTSSHNVGAALGGTGKTGTDSWGTTADYSAHYDGFQFYASTANPHHLAPASLSVVGTDSATPGQFNTANHNYDVSTFNDLVGAINSGQLPATNFPAVSYLKAPVYETGHPATSDPIDEQNWIVNEVNLIESLPTWNSTAIFLTYDDSDGWYDHVYGGITNPSDTTADALTGADACGTVPAVGATGYGTTPVFDEQGRCGPGPRLPLIVISPYAKRNYVSDAMTPQSSILNFIETNWNLGQIQGSFASTAGSLDDLFNFNNQGQGNQGQGNQGQGNQGQGNQGQGNQGQGNQGQGNQGQGNQGQGNQGQGNPSAPGPNTTPPFQASTLILNPQTGEPSYPIIGTISPSSGPAAGGNQVTINGINLPASGTTFWFGSQRATNVSCTASATLAAPAATCQLTVPPAMHSGTGQVTISVYANGQYGVNDAGAYSYS